MHHHDHYRNYLGPYRTFTGLNTRLEKLDMATLENGAIREIANGENNCFDSQ